MSLEPAKATSLCNVLWQQVSQVNCAPRKILPLRVFNLLPRNARLRPALVPRGCRQVSPGYSRPHYFTGLCHTPSPSLCWGVLPAWAHLTQEPLGTALRWDGHGGPGAGGARHTDAVSTRVPRGAWGACAVLAPPAGQGPWAGRNPLLAPTRPAGASWR